MIYNLSLCVNTRLLSVERIVCATAAYAIDVTTPSIGVRGGDCDGDGGGGVTTRSFSRYVS